MNKTITASTITAEVDSNKKPINWYVQEQIEQGVWREELIPASVLGLSRPLTIVRAARKSNLIAYRWHGDRETFCPPQWWDLAVGSGPCGLGCSACFLMLTFRAMRDPMRHLLYDNVEEFHLAARSWLLSPKRLPRHTLGLGIDRSDSLLYEGVTGHARALAPLFGNRTTNPHGCKLILLTKSANTHYLAEIKPEHRANLVVTFSLNPQEIADLWEGVWLTPLTSAPDTGASGGRHANSTNGSSAALTLSTTRHRQLRASECNGDGLERIAPSISRRLEAARAAQDLGFEVRIRLDPILTVPGWETLYAEFISEVKRQGINFRYWTLGTYREKNSQLDHWRELWGLAPMGWQPDHSQEEGGLVAEGTHHRSLPALQRAEIYRVVTALIRQEFEVAQVSLCKETRLVRKTAGLCNATCNCLH